MMSLKKINKTFDPRGIAGVHDVSFDILKGSVFALMGPNGSGKTTLLNIISGKITPDSGEIKARGKIHFFEKKNPPLDMNVQKFLIESVQDNSISPEKKLQLARDFADIFEFTFQLRQSVGQLSQGQRQKVLMAAELINQPDILFLDEPFIHLDPMSRKDILNDLFVFLKQREVTVLWVTHEKDEALRFADEIGLIQHGKMEQISTPSDMLKKPRNVFVAQFFGHQNFMKVIQEDGLWKTPWGNFPFPLKDLEGYLVIPTTAWKEDNTSLFEGTIVHQYPQYFCWNIELAAADKYYRIGLPLTHELKWKIGQKLKLSVDLTSCLIIPL